MFAPRKPILTTLVSIGLLGCASIQPAPAQTVEAADITSRQLQGLADGESHLVHPVTPAPPAPPGLPSALLDVRAPRDTAARLSLEEVLGQAAPDDDPDRGVRPSDIGPAARDAALRHYVKGRFEAQDKHFMAAVLELEKAVALDPTSTEIVRELANSYRAVGNPAKALEYFERLARLDPEDSSAVLNVALARANRQEFAESLAVIALHRRSGRRFTHDPTAEALADYIVFLCMRSLGYDRALIDAGSRVVNQPAPANNASAFAMQINAIRQQESEWRRVIGDAWCRLGDDVEALKSYTAASMLESAPSHGLVSRIISANLRLGRFQSAQLALVRSIAVDPASISPRQIRLCEYLTEHVDHVDAVFEAIETWRLAMPDHSGLCRAAAVVAPQRGFDRLAAFVERHPRDLDAVHELLRLEARRDIAAAVERTVDLVRQHPDLAGPYADRLGAAAPSRSDAVAAAGAMDPSPAAANVECRLLLGLGAMGAAWRRAEEAHVRWPQSGALMLHRLELAALLQERSLFDRALIAADDVDDQWAWIVRARTQRAMDRHGAAVKAANRAVSMDDASVAAWTELARARAGAAGILNTPTERSDAAKESVIAAEQALTLAPGHEGAYEVLLSLYGSGGLRSHARRYRQTARRIEHENPASPLFNLVAAQESMNLRRHDEAIERLLSIYVSDPLSVECLSLAVSVWSAAEELPLAEAWLSQQRKARSDDPALLDQWVRTVILQQRTADAVIVLEDLVATKPNFVAATVLLESLYESVDRTHDAFRLAQDRLLRRPAGLGRASELAAIYGDAQQNETAIAQLEWILDHADDASAEQMVGAVLVASQIESHPGADALVLRTVEATTARYPNVPLQVYGLALRALARRDDFGGRFDDVALAAARDAVGSSDPSISSVLLWRNLAQALIDEGLPAAAARALRARLRVAANLDADARSLLTVMSLVADAGAGDRSQASIELVRDLSQRGALPEIRGVDGAPSEAAVLNQASQMYAVIGDLDGAQNLLAEAVRLDPDEAMMLNNLGYMRVEIGRDDPETVVMIERAGDLLPDEANILDTIGWLRYKQGRFERTDDEPLGAVDLIRHAIEVDIEPSAEVHDHLGDVLWRLDAPEEAAAAWRTGIKLLEDPPHRERSLQEFLLYQTRIWGLLVADPNDIYDREYGRRLEQMRRKLASAEQGDEPSIAPTFAELGPATGQAPRQE